MFTQTRTGRAALATTTAAFLIMALGADTAMATNVVHHAHWSKSCPPNGYGNPQPPLDCDTDGDGVNDAWCAPLTVNPPISGGGGLTLPCIPDPSGPGNGSDHYSPRVDGVEMGQCVYTCGRNSWDITTDCNGKVIKSKWTSRDGGTNWKFTGHSKTFCNNIITTIASTLIVDTGPRGSMSPFEGYVINDAVLVDAGTPLNEIILNGRPIEMVNSSMRAIGSATPGGAGEGTPEQTDGSRVIIGIDTALELTSLTRATGNLRTMQVTGTITNTDSAPHNYEIVLFGVNLALDTDRLTAALAPGESFTYVASATELTHDNCAVVALASTETGGADDFVVKSETIFVRKPGGADLDGDGFVSVSDLNGVLGAFGRTGPNMPEDLNVDGVINAADLAIMIGEWGAVSKPARK